MYIGDQRTRGNVGLLLDGAGDCDIEHVKWEYQMPSFTGKTGLQEFQVPECHLEVPGQA